MLLIANTSLRYPDNRRGNNYVDGDLFEASERDAKTLIANGMAKAAPPPVREKRRYKRRDMQAVDDRQLISDE